jgi:hypothetical protein
MPIGSYRCLADIRNEVVTDRSGWRAFDLRNRRSAPDWLPPLSFRGWLTGPGPFRTDGFPDSGYQAATVGRGHHIGGD